MPSRVVLYDIPSQQGTSWSLNAWKTRMILNYKGIDYETQWIEFPDLAPTFQSLGIPPNDKNTPGYYLDYSCPAIRYEDGKYGMDSWLIAQELEKRYPTRSLYLDDPIVIQVRDHIDKLLGPMIPHLMPKMPLLMSKLSAEYFYETREKWFGVSMTDLEKRAGEKNWENSVPPAKETGDLLRKNGGPFFLGETVSYADFIVVSMLHFIKRIDKDGTVFERYLALDPAFSKMYEASRQWLERQD